METVRTVEHSGPKVLHVSGLPGLGGLELRLLEYLSRVDPDRHAYCVIDPHSSALDQLRALPVPVYEIRRRWRSDPRLILKIASVIRTERPDVVYARGFTGALWAYLASRIAGVKYFVRGEHGSITLMAGAMRRVDRYLMRRSDLVIANSESTKLEVARAYDVPEDRIEVAYNGIDFGGYPDSTGRESVRRELRVGPNTRIVGNVGTFFPWKDQLAIIEAAPRVLSAHPDTLFVFAGGFVDEGWFRKCADTAEQLGLGERVRFLGHRDDVTAIHSAFDIFVLPSRKETFGNVVVEAAAAGTPIVAARVGGVPEIIEDDVTGLLITPTLSGEVGAVNVDEDVDGDTMTKRLDPTVLAERIIELMDDPERAKCMALDASSRVRDKFTVSQYDAALDSVYRELMRSAS